MAADSHGDKNEPQYAGSGIPQDAADLTEVAAYAAKVGNRRVGTTDQRNAAIGTSDVWEGLEWYDTTDDNTYLWSGPTSGWVPRFGDTLWITPTPIAGTSPNVQYRRLNGVMWFTGTWVPTADSQIMFRLPGGFRPLNTGTWWCERGVQTGPAAKVEIQASTGSVIYRQSASGTGPINFVEITFPADQ